MPGGFQEDRPIFLQIAEMLEDAILTGAFPEGEQVPSTFFHNIIRDSISILYK